MSERVQIESAVGLELLQKEVREGIKQGRTNIRIITSYECLTGIRDQDWYLHS